MGFAYDLTSIFTIWHPPDPPVSFEGIRMDAYQPSCAGPVFHAIGNKMVRVKDFRFHRAKYNVYQFVGLYFSPAVCIAGPVFIFEKQADWTWWLVLFLMLNFWIWVGGILLSTFVTAWALGFAHGVRQEPTLTLRVRFRKLFNVFFSFDWNIEDNATAAKDLNITPAKLGADAPATEETDRAEDLHAKMRQLYEQLAISERERLAAVARANIAVARVDALEAMLDDSVEV